MLTSVFAARQRSTTAPGQPRQGPLMAVNRMLAASTIINLKSHPLAGKKITELAKMTGMTPE